MQAWFERGSVLGTTIHRRDGEDVAQEPQELEIKQETLDLGLQYEAFLRAIEQQTDPLNSFQEALENFHLIHAIEQSLETGQPQDLMVSATRE